jgi:predicted AAA+ superfamily ATPase
MEKENLEYVLAQHTERKLPDATPRAVQLPLDSRKVVTLVGIRRSGKRTTACCPSGLTSST